MPPRWTFLKWLFGRSRAKANKDSNYEPEYATPDIARINAPDPAKTQVTWVGHATFLIQVAGINILTDPMWSERASMVQFRGWRREARPGIAFEDLPKIDLVLISHTHYDHMDRATILRLGDTPHYIVPTGVAKVVRKRTYQERHRAFVVAEHQLRRAHRAQRSCKALVDAMDTAKRRSRLGRVRDRNPGRKCLFRRRHGISRRIFQTDRGAISEHFTGAHPYRRIPPAPCLQWRPTSTPTRRSSYTRKLAPNSPSACTGAYSRCLRKNCTNLHSFWRRKPLRREFLPKNSP